MIASTIWKELKSTLENNPTLKDYVKVVFSGIRFKLEPDSLPCIMLEPVIDNEIETDLNQIKRQWLSIDVFAYSDYNVTDFDKTIVGGRDYKGVLDIANDIRACLQSSNTLGDNVYDIQFEPTEFARIDDDEKYPVRVLVIPIKILYQQNKGV